MNQTSLMLMHCTLLLIEIDVIQVTHISALHHILVIVIVLSKNVVKHVVKALVRWLGRRTLQQVNLATEFQGMWDKSYKERD